MKWMHLLFNMKGVLYMKLVAPAHMQHQQSLTSERL